MIGIQLTIRLRIVFGRRCRRHRGHVYIDSDVIVFQSWYRFFSSVRNIARIDQVANYWLVAAEAAYAFR